MSTYVKGMGYYVPETLLDNNTLAAMVETSDEWITSRTGIKSRRIVGQNQSCSDLVVEAARMALASSGVEAQAISHIIVCTVSGDAAFPATACLAQQKLGIAKAMSFDLSAACSGFLYGMQVAQGLITVDPKAVILLAGAEVLSHLVNWQDRGTCVLFGDGAGAVVLAAESTIARSSHPLATNAVIEGILCEGNADGAELLYSNAGGSRSPYKPGDRVGPEYFIHMNGQEIFKTAIRTMCGVSTKLLKSLGLTVDDIDLVIPHQANLRIIKGVLERLGVAESKVFINLEKYGNTSAASIPMALCEAHLQGRIRPGSRVLFTTFGAGLTWGAAVVRFQS